MTRRSSPNSRVERDAKQYARLSSKSLRFREHDRAHWAALVEELERLETEAKTVYRELVLPNWGKELHGFPDTLYGFMMGLFARVDMASAYWKGNFDRQTRRMVSFMDFYVSSNHEANSVAVQMWRHKLMHTSQPRYLRDEKTNKTYRWLLQWWEHLPAERHYTFVETSDSRILNIGLIYLITDLRRAIERFIRDLQGSLDLQAKFKRVEDELATSTYREIA